MVSHVHPKNIPLTGACLPDMVLLLQAIFLFAKMHPLSDKIYIKRNLNREGLLLKLFSQRCASIKFNTKDFYSSIL